MNVDMANIEVTMNSIELVDMINEFREIEGRKAVLRHGSFMTKIRTDLETLEALGLNNEQNILLVDYVDSKGETRPCYELNRDGCLQMLNGESVLVRHKTIEYMKKLEEENLMLLESYDDMKEIAESDEDIEVRLYKAKVVDYSWKRIRPMLEDCSYNEIEEVVNSIITFHSEVLKKKDRCKYDSHAKANNTEYKQIVREHVYKILNDIYCSSRDNKMIVIVSDIKEGVLSNILETSNRSTSKKLSHRQDDIDALTEQLGEGFVTPSEDDMCLLDVSGFSHNYMYNYDKYRVCRTHAYNKWIKNFPKEQVKLDWEGVDFTKPIELILGYVCKEQIDVRNLDKATQDMLFNRCLEVDDNIIDGVYSYRVGTANSYADGKILFYIRNK